MDIKLLLPILEERMRFLELMLKNTPGVTGLGFTINSGVWANESGFCVGFLSCARSPQDETIDLTIDISSNEDNVSLEAGIYYSDGSLIQDFRSVNLPGRNFDELRLGVEGFFDQVSTNELLFFGKVLCNQNGKPN